MNTSFNFFAGILTPNQLASDKNDCVNLVDQAPVGLDHAYSDVVFDQPSTSTGITHSMNKAHWNISEPVFNKPQNTSVLRPATFIHKPNRYDWQVPDYHNRKYLM